MNELILKYNTIVTNVKNSFQFISDYNLAPEFIKAKIVHKEILISNKVNINKVKHEETLVKSKEFKDYEIDELAKLISKNRKMYEIL